MPTSVHDEAAMDKIDERYDISTQVLYAPLQTMDVTGLAAAQTPWWNRTLGEVNDAVVRLAVMEGDFHWHQHDEEDEFFYVLEGALTIEVEGCAPFELKPGQGVTVPKATRHCPHAHGRTVVLMVEKGTVVPTGD
jgi:mannose-6-phosphate isomerase-like protein (cupin superfamily)